MSGRLSEQQRATWEELIRRNLRRYLRDTISGPTAIVNLLVESNVLGDVLAAEREAGAAEVRELVAVVLESTRNEAHLRYEPGSWKRGARHVRVRVLAAMRGDEVRTLTAEADQ